MISLKDTLSIRVKTKKIMNTFVLVISLIIVSVVVIIIPPCGAALGRRKA
ncbi:IlvGMEDA operon leader peptide (modular protein) [Xenorhabdus bovienii]|uniref:ilv operon leader peptide n=9 Tax=Morganellaceae TaxID=1903414 RepID=A0A0B6XED4_XENBV|nr:IlvGMEDA operon leader peptide (modular protein) [Xenorhabdus bovienii]